MESGGAVQVTMRIAAKDTLSTETNNARIGLFFMGSKKTRSDFLFSFFGLRLITSIQFLKRLQFNVMNPDL